MGRFPDVLDVRALEVTTSNVGDTPMLPELLNQIPADQTIGTVITDGAYDTRRCHDVIAARNAHAVNASRYLGRAISLTELIARGLHRRS